MSQSREQALSKLRQMIDGIPVAILTTLDQDGALRSRPMAAPQMDQDGVLWFFSTDYSPKVQDVRVHPQVSVSYSAPDQNRFVSLSGKADLVTDTRQIERLWKPALKAWFPRGAQDPDLALLRVDVLSAQYWDAPSSKLVQLLGVVKAAVGADPGKLAGEQEKLTLKTRIASDTVT